MGCIANRCPCLSLMPSLASFGWASTNDNVWISSSGGSSTSTCHEFVYTICSIRFMRGFNIFHTLYAIAYDTYFGSFVDDFCRKYCCGCCRLFFWSFDGSARFEVPQNVENILCCNALGWLLSFASPLIDCNQMMRISLRKMDKSLILYGLNCKVPNRPCGKQGIERKRKEINI